MTTTCPFCNLSEVDKAQWQPGNNIIHCGGCGCEYNVEIGVEYYIKHQDSDDVDPLDISDFSKKRWMEKERVKYIAEGIAPENIGALLLGHWYVEKKRRQEIHE